MLNFISATARRRLGMFARRSADLYQFGRAGERGWPTRGRIRLWAIAAVMSLFVTVFPVTETTPATAVPRGEGMTFPGGLTISNYVMPNGLRAYCIEVDMPEPSGYLSAAARLDFLPGRSGRFHSWKHAAGLRQMNYLIDTHGQRRDGAVAAAVQLTIWRMRENFHSGNSALNQKIAVLQRSPQGRAALVRSDALYADAVRAARAPVAAAPITAQLELTPADGEYTVVYPRGTRTLTVSGGTFGGTGHTSRNVDGGVAGTMTVTPDENADRLEVTGTWRTEGSRGWDSALEVHDTFAASGAIGQRLGVAVARSAVPERHGRFSTIAQDVPRPTPPTVSSQADPSAEVGGTARDTLLVRAPATGQLRMWPEAEVTFTAYLYPEVGAVKYADNWEPLPAMDASSGPEVGADPGPAPLSDTAPFTQSPSSDEKAQPRLASPPEPARWTAAELAGLSEAERCLAQPVYRSVPKPVQGLGNVVSDPVPLHAAGTLHWVERVTSEEVVVHEGACGLPNERTTIGQPGVVTQALPEVAVGAEATDTALVSGRLLPELEYTLVFEAFSADTGGLWSPLRSPEPSCTAENRVFRSPPIKITEPGEVQSPPVVATWDHGRALWWVETLTQRRGEREQVLHRGVCGLATETTNVLRPEVTTQARETAVVGDWLVDTAHISGALVSNERLSWEVSFAGYRAPSDRGETAETGDPGPESVCAAENQLFTTPAVPVTGIGVVTSPPVRAEPEWAGTLWWVETLWLIEDGERRAVHTGACGIPTETTVLTAPEVTTRAVDFVPVGGLMRDTATVVGALTTEDGVGYEVVFEGYRGDRFDVSGTPQCLPESRLFVTDPVPLATDGTAQSPEVRVLPSHGSAVWWVETLQRTDTTGVYPVHRGICGVPHETTVVQYPEVTTESVGEIRVGEDLFDRAQVGGLFATDPGAEYRLRFFAYQTGPDGELRCTPEFMVSHLSDETGVRITGPGSYQSEPKASSIADAGAGGFVAELVMVLADGSEYAVHTGTCGDPDEAYVIHEPTSPPDSPAQPEQPLPNTGSSEGGGWLGWSAALITAALGCGLLLWRKRVRGIHNTSAASECGVSRHYAVLPNGIHRFRRHS